MADPVLDLSRAVAAAAAELGGGSPPDLALERPKNPDHGDYSTNAAMLLAPVMGKAPREIAGDLGEALTGRLGNALERVDVAGPGFLNLVVSDGWCAGALAGALAAGDSYGAAQPGSAGRVNVEFVSANPTGPITVAAGRHAAYGDALCRILERAGAEVDREYYVNDHGTQVERFAQSIRARAAGDEPPEDGYRGAYVADVAQEIGEVEGLSDAELAKRGVQIMLAGIRSTLERFGVFMDRFASEEELYESGAVARALDRLGERDHVYSHESATWLRTTSFGDDKDRVLVRSQGDMTYFAGDIAYHEDKRERGYDTLIDIWGADHHGYVGRMHAAWSALGGRIDSLEIVIMQLVNLLEGGQRAQMSKRQGEFVTLDDLIDDIGVDATRWFLLQRSHDTTLDLDLELARTRSQENPVYYAQYAHARIASILRKAGPERVEEALSSDLAASPERFGPSERGLVKRLVEFPGEVEEAARRRAAHRMTVYATETAQDFSAFYRDCKVVGASEEGGDENVRIGVCELTRRVLATSLGLLGVSAPEEM